jgi:hypothetical protein
MRYQSGHSPRLVCLNETYEIAYVLQFVDFVVSELNLKFGFNPGYDFEQVEPIDPKVLQKMSLVLQDVLLHMQMFCQQVTDRGFWVLYWRFLREILPIHDRLPSSWVLAIMESKLGSNGGGDELFWTRCT